MEGYSSRFVCLFVCVCVCYRLIFVNTQYYCFFDIAFEKRPPLIMCTFKRFVEKILYGKDTVLESQKKRFNAVMPTHLYYRLVAIFFADVSIKHLTGQL